MANPDGRWSRTSPSGLDPTCPAGARSIHAPDGRGRPGSPWAPAGPPAVRFAPSASVLRHRAWLHSPDLAGIFGDGAIARKLSGRRDIQNGFARPLVAVRVEFAQSLLRLDVRRQVRQMHVVIALGQKRAAQRLEKTGLVATEMIGENQVQS